jgi:hypothetical protein
MERKVDRFEKSDMFEFLKNICNTNYAFFNLTSEHFMTRKYPYKVYCTLNSSKHRSLLRSPLLAKCLTANEAVSITNYLQFLFPKCCFYYECI